MFELFLYQEGTALQVPREFLGRDQVQEGPVSVRGTPGLGPMPVGSEELCFSAAWWAPYGARARSCCGCQSNGKMALRPSWDCTGHGISPPSRRVTVGCQFLGLLQLESFSAQGVGSSISQSVRFGRPPNAPPSSPTHTQRACTQLGCPSSLFEKVVWSGPAP